MAASLPPLDKMATPRSGRSQVTRNDLVQPTPPRTGTPKSRAGTSLTSKSMALKNANRKEQEIIFRRERLRAEQPVLSKGETAAYRNTFKHNLCLDMLQAGYHRSFGELHYLMKKQADTRLAAGPDSMIWNEPLLDTEFDKLESLKFYLTEAEEALRVEDLQTVYQHRFALAQYFQGRGDKWLSDHFFQTCLEVSSKEVGGEERLCQALCFVGLAQEENGELFDAVDRFEEYFELSDSKTEWRTENGQTFHKDACDHLTRLYTKISDSLDSEHKVARVEYLVKAYNTAKEGNDDKLAGVAAYRLGVAYTKTGDPKTGLMYLKMYLEVCETGSDDIGIGKACEAIAKAYDSDGKTEESVKYLVRFVEVSERSRQDMALATACSNLGYIYNAKGDYAEASKYFSKAFSISRSKNNRPGAETSSVHYGIANALSMFGGVQSHLVQRGKHQIMRLATWKNQRHDEFSKPVPTEVPEESILLKRESSRLSDEQSTTLELAKEISKRVTIGQLHPCYISFTRAAESFLHWND